MKAKYFALALWALAPMLNAAPEVFTGTLGKLPVVVEIDADGDDATGRYFYEKFHKDLPLAGTLKGNQLVLAEGDPSAETPQAQLLLQRDGEGWAGQWQGANGKRLPVSLARAQIPPLPEGAGAFMAQQRQEAPYDYLRLLQTPLKPGKQSAFMGYSLQWLQEPVTGLSMPQLSSGYTDAQRQRLNAALRDRLLAEVVNWHSCQASGGSNFDYTQSVAPTYFSASVISLNLSTGYDCGGAHPDSGDAGLNLSVETGQELTLEDVLWLGQGPAKHYEQGSESKDFEALSQYRDDQFAPWVLKVFKRLHPADMKAPKSEDDCDYSDASVWDFPSWHFTEKGLYLGPYFARVMRACEGPEWSILPWAEVKAHPGAAKLALP